MMFLVSDGEGRYLDAAGRLVDAVDAEFLTLQQAQAVRHKYGGELISERDAVLPIAEIPAMAHWWELPVACWVCHGELVVENEEDATRRRCTTCRARFLQMVRDGWLWLRRLE